MFEQLLFMAKYFSIIKALRILQLTNLLLQLLSADYFLIYLILQIRCLIQLFNLNLQIVYIIFHFFVFLLIWLISSLNILHTIEEIFQTNPYLIFILFAQTTPLRILMRNLKYFQQIFSIDQLGLSLHFCFQNNS